MAYIERESAIKSLLNDSPEQVGYSREDAADCIRYIDAADVAPVRHGRWEPVLEGVWNVPIPVLVGWRCSQCGRTEQEKEPYCNCGAKMDGGASNAVG